MFQDLFLNNINWLYKLTSFEIVSFNAKQYQCKKIDEQDHNDNYMEHLVQLKEFLIIGELAD